MTKSEYMERIQKKADASKADLSKRVKIRRGVFASVLCLGSAAVCLVGGQQSDILAEENYTRFVESPAVVQLENLDYKDTFDIWNGTVIGNDVNCLLSGGEIYARGDLVITPKNSEETGIRKGTSDTTVFGGRASYINVWGNTVVYRSEARNLMAYDMGRKTTKTIRGGNVGEVFVSEGKIYYTSISDRRLNAIEMNGSGVTTIIDTPVDTFAVLGDTILYRDFQSNLICYTISTGSSESFGQGVERFFIAGDIIIESGNKIYKTDSEGRNPSVIYESGDDSMRLVGVAGQLLLIQEGGKLRSMNRIDGSFSNILKSEYTLYRSLCVDDNTLYAIAYKDADAAVVSTYLLAVDLSKDGAFEATEIVEKVEETPTEQSEEKAEVTEEVATNG